MLYQLLFLLFSLSISGCGIIRGIELSNANLQTAISNLISDCDTTIMQGDGTAGNPYIICSLEQFYKLNTATAGEYYVLHRDINFTENSLPITTMFVANLDGDQHTLNDLHYFSTGTQLGLFNIINGGTVSNLTLNNFKLSLNTAINGIGALAGRATNATISNVSVTNSVITGRTAVGGLVGTDNSSDYSEIHITNTAVVGMNNAGLLFGKTSAQLTSVTKSIIQGYLSGGAYTGGIAGTSPNINVTETGIFAQITVAQDNYAVGHASPHRYIGGMFGSVTGLTLENSYFVGEIINSTNATNGIGTFAGLASNTNVYNTYFATNKLIDVLGNSTNFNGYIGVNNGSNVVSGVNFYNHNFTPSNENGDVTVLNASGMRDPNNYYYDFGDPDPDYGYIGMWQMATNSKFKFPVFSTQSAAQPFENIEYRSTPASEVSISETTAVNGYTFAKTRSDSEAFTFLTFTNNTGGVIYLKTLQMGGIRNSFHIADGLNAGTCSALLNSAVFLAQGNQCTIGIQFKPDQITNINELHRDALLVGYTIGGTKTTYIYPIEGEAQLAGPLLTGTNATIGNVILGYSSSPVNTIFTNSAVDAGTIISYTTSDPVYTIDDTACPIGTILNATETCTLTINFTPTAIQPYPATLTVVYEDTLLHTQKTKVITLTGAGIEHPFNDDPSGPCQIADGTNAKPFCVYNRAELETVELYDSTSSFIQTADIDLTGAPFHYVNRTLAINTGKFYDGQNHTIKNYVSDHGGLFVMINQGTLKNLIMDSPVVVRAAQNEFVGGVVGYMLNGALVDNVKVIGTGTVAFDSQVYGANKMPAGGLVGRIDGSTVTNCEVHFTSVAGDENVGGLVGWLGWSGSISNSKAYVTNVVAPGRYVGGLVGYMAGGSITGSYASGTVTGLKTRPVSNSSEFVGGLVGLLESSSVSNSSADVTVISNDSEAGGLIGRIGAGGSWVANSYSTGTVTSTRNMVGGFVGRMLSGTSVTNSFSLGTASGGAASVGGFAGDAAGTINNSFSATRTVSGSNDVGGFVGTNSGAISNSYSLADTVPALHAFVGTNTGTLTNVYSNADGTSDTNSTGILSTDMATQGNWALDFGTPTWRMPSTNPGTYVLSPVPAWACNLAATGIICP